MQELGAVGEPSGRIVCFVPRWIPESMSAIGMPYTVFPVLSSLARAGFTVQLFTEVHDDLAGEELTAALQRCDGALAWCAELNPGVQVPGLLRFLARAREVVPDVPRVFGGAFLYLVPETARGLPGLADHVVSDNGVPSVAEFFAARLAAARGQAFAPGKRIGSNLSVLDPLSLRELDLRQFARPESMLFDNDAPTLQLPTGLGCAKRCRFCFYERLRVALMPGPLMAELMCELQQRLGVDQYMLGEFDAFVSKPRILAFVDTLIARGATLRWFALVSIADVEAMTDEELVRLRRSGCVTLELGTEVGSDAALRKIGKHYAAAAAVRTSVRLERAGILPLHNILLGWVGETDEDRRATLRQVERIHQASPRARFNFRAYQAVPNTTMGDMVLGRDNLPTNLLAVAEWRLSMLAGRAMPWLDERTERRVRSMVDYWLPLAYGDRLAGRSGWRRRLLRTLARWRCNTGVLTLPVDRWAFRRFETAGLPGTFLA